jgi:hypothetical protein
VGLDVYDDIEACFAGGWSDGLPVIPPYGSLVDRMLAAMGWAANDVVGRIDAQDIEIHAEHVAAAAVMAGCKVDYGRLLRAVSEALTDEHFNLSAVEVTTGGASALVIVGGPIVQELGFEWASNALGANNRANATVGRFAQLVRYFCGRGGGTLHSHGTMGHPGRISFCIAESPEAVWPSFHTQDGIASGTSAVSVMSTEGPNSVNNHYGETAEGLLDTIADCLAHAGTTNYYWHTATYLVVIGPDHMDLIGASFTRDEARRYLYERAVRSTDDLARMGRVARVPRPESKVEFGAPRSPFDREEQITFIECGARGGKFSAIIPGWVGNTKMISRIVTAE